MMTCPFCGSVRLQTVGGECGDPFNRRPERTVCLDCEHDAELCFSFWAVKAQLLLERGILWRSPAALNPGVLFD